MIPNKTVTISHEEMSTLWEMQQSKSKDDLRLMQGIIKGYCEMSDGNFCLKYNNKTKKININPKSMEEKYYPNLLYSEMCRMWKDKPSKPKYKEFTK